MGFAELLSQLAFTPYDALLPLFVWMLGFLAAMGIVTYMVGLCWECFSPASRTKRRGAAVDGGLNDVGIWAPSESVRVILRIRPGS